jgi:ATP-binding cassette subfamily F protein 3
MIQLSSAGKRFGPKLLLEDVAWQITPGDRIGLVGANGSGKTTLLKVLAGTESLDSGTLSLPKGFTAGYLPQYGLSLSGCTVFEECLSVFGGLRIIEQELEALTRRMAELDPSSAEYSEGAERFQRLEGEFRSRDGYALEAKVGAVLSGLTFPKSDWTRRTEEFSGGWQMRIALAKLLLEKPNLLLLDEPTNHLDLDARNWLEEYLASYPHAFVVVSHDRYFLDVTVSRIVEIWNRKLHFYAANYSRHLEQKAQRRAQLQAAFKNQQDRIRQLEAFIHRFRYKATKARQVQSRLKELERIERIELPPDEEAIRFSFPQPKPSGRIVAELRNVTKRYSETPVFENVSFLIERGDRIALVGVNGAGKSTLIKILSGIDTASSGEFRLGHNVAPDYFAQDQYREFDPVVRIIDDLGEVAPRATQTELRSLLGCFLFAEEDVFKRIGVLSGGERNRYALARLLLRPSNFLLLDEPTNHLDMRGKDVLLGALEGYSGTLIFVSHDRYFIDRLATRVFEVGDRQVLVYQGNYEDYLWRKEGRAAEEPSPPASLEGPPKTEESERSSVAKPRRLNPIRLRQLQDRCEAIEEEIARLEAEIAQHERALSVFKSAEETRRLGELLKQRRADLGSLLSEWEEISQAIAANSG